MWSFPVAVSAVVLSLSVQTYPSVPVSSPLAAVDTISPPVVLVTVPRPVTSGLGIADAMLAASSDTIRQPRAKAIVYSDLYQLRLTWHRRLSYTMLPLFALSYASGDQLLKKGSDAPEWARTIHGPAASGSAILFGANTFTGAWNLWEGRANPTGRTRRIVHSVLFTAASGGFVYAGTKLASDAQQSQDKRLQHRNIAIASMGVSTASWLLMLIGN